MPFDRSVTDIYYLLDRLIEFLKCVTLESRREILIDVYKKLRVSQFVDGSDYLLNWDEIKCLAANDIMFGSHTHTHALLDHAEKGTVDYELVESRRVLEQKLGIQVNMFSYPNGYFKNQYVQESLGVHGYEYAFTLERKPLGHSDHFSIPRFMLYEDIAYSMDRYFLKVLFSSMLRK